MAVPDRRVSKTRAAKGARIIALSWLASIKAKDGTWKLPHHINKFTKEY